MTAHSTLKRLLTLATVAVLTECELSAQRAASPADATVFIRLVGSVHADIDDGVTKQTADLARVEIGTGSGFVISPHGYVLTNEHVIGNREFVVRNGLATTKLTLSVSRIDVCFAVVASQPGGSSRCVEASVHSADRALDLAVLFVSAPDLPYVALGDSDVVRAAQPVEALGYPFGRQLEVGRTAALDLVPEVSVSPGTISSLRSDDVSERRVIQVNAAINPGNSGGPLVDEDGYAVGVIRARVVGDAGIGFAIPINLAKDFLESNGLDSLMPVRRLRLGPFENIEGKGLGLRLPVGVVDGSPFRSRIESEVTDAGLALRIDRGYSPWAMRQIEQALVETEAFERVSIASRDSRLASRSSGESMLLGRAVGSTDTEPDVRMNYGIVDMGSEALIGRYVGSAEVLAYNESVLRESLLSLEGRSITVQTQQLADGLVWAVRPASDTVLPIPADWHLEPGAPTECDLPQANRTFAAYPPRDITVALRLAVWNGGDVAPEKAATSCAPGRGSLGPGSYGLRAEWLGVSYSIDGIFVRIGQQRIAQLEVIAPLQKRKLAQDLLAAWTKQAGSR